jgi:hypothetical protein
MCETIPISVGLDTTQLQLDNVNDFMVEWIKAEEIRGIMPQVSIYSTAIWDATRLDVDVIMCHRNNHQDGGLRVARRTRFMLKLMEAIRACGVVLVIKPLEH